MNQKTMFSNFKSKNIDELEREDPANVLSTFEMFLIQDLIKMGRDNKEIRIKVESHKALYAEMYANRIRRGLKK